MQLNRFVSARVAILGAGVAMAGALEEEQAPAGALAISCELPCRKCDSIIERASFRAYLAR